MVFQSCALITERRDVNTAKSNFAIPVCSQAQLRNKISMGLFSRGEGFPAFDFHVLLARDELLQAHG